MRIFKLPDLGEGLPDAEIHAWFVKPGDTVTADQPLVSMETAKALVDVPCPEAGVIEVLFGKPGEVIRTGAPLVQYTPTQPSITDQGTVVGELAHDTALIDLNHLPLTTITPRKRVRTNTSATPPPGFTALHGTRRAMLQNMQLSHQQVVPVSIFDEADISNWIHTDDITLRVIRALVVACAHEPALNAWFDSASNARHCCDEVHLGLAMDSDEGLFVPVIHHVKTQSDQTLRELINQYKQAVATRSLPPEQFQGATITLSNFGKFAGRFATPLVIPPMVAILAVGRVYEGVISVAGAPQSRTLLPLSLSFDHRAVTGGEATRFLGHVLNALL
jgi:pyruvate dehydrogenase E2 component (dihydrolipoamide acetyltransferase)